MFRSIPINIWSLRQGSLLQAKGRCESFGEGGDGYVPGEGVGAVLLKPLTKAIADRDHIYGIIKGTAIIMAGKPTVISPQSQCPGRSHWTSHCRKQGLIPDHQLSGSARHRDLAGRSNRNYGLTKAFRKYTDDKQFCAIGSAEIEYRAL